MKPKRTTGQGARSYVQAQQPFTNSNDQLYGQWETPQIYVVYSYGDHWPLFMWNDVLKLWFENEEKYSATTSKHRSSTHPHTPTEKRTRQWLRKQIQEQRQLTREAA